MNYPVIFAIVFCLATTNHASNDGGCTIDGINWSNNLYTNEPILDTDILKKDFTFTGDLEVNCSPVGNSCRYIAASVEGNTLTFATTQAFIDNFEEETMEVADQVRINVNVIFTCVSGDTSLTFRVDVTGTNNHDPEYLESTYEFLVPMPMLPKIDITTLGPQIIAKDIDFSNTNIVFTIDPADKFLITTQNLGNKQYRAAISVSEATRLSEDTTFQLTATDDGGVPVVSSVTIKIDRDSSLPNVPLFSGPFFNFDYSVVDGNAVLTPSDGDITVITDFPDLTTVTLTGNDLFAADYNKETNVVTINALGVLVDPVEHVIVLTLDAKIDGNSQSGTTAILIHIPDEIMIQVPKFSSPFYAATYSTDSEPHTVTVDGDIFVTDNADNVDVALTGDNSDCFTLTKNAENHWELGVLKNLPDAVLDAGGDVVLTLEGTVTDGEISVDPGYATLIIKLPIKAVIPVPEFIAPYYPADYSTEAEQHTVTIEGIIGVKENAPIIEVVLTGDNSEFFSLTKNEDNNWDLSVAENLPDPVLDAGGDVVLTLEATVTGESVDPGYATLIIKLPVKPVIPVPEFINPYYPADYSTESEQHTVTVEGIIGVKENAPIIEVVLTGDNSEFFSLTKNEDNNWDLSVVENLPDPVLDAGGDVVLTLGATVTGESVDPGYATLIIKLPVKPSVIPVPEFTAPYYPADYLTDAEQHTVAVQGTIGVKENAVNTEVALTGDNSEFFVLTKNADNNWDLTLSENLPGPVLDAGGNVILTLGATVTGESVDPGYATLIVKLPVKPVISVPEFTTPYYPADYSSDAAQHTVVVRGTIGVKENAASTEVTLDGDYKENFELTKNSDNNWDLTVVANLPDPVLQAGGDVILSLKATASGQPPNGYATLIIKLPSQSAIPVPQFTSPYYPGTYSTENDPHTVEVDGPITVTGNFENTAVVLSGDYADHFTLNKDADHWNLGVKENLPPEVLGLGGDVILSLEATVEDQTGFGTLIIKLPPVAPSPAPKFAKSHYSGTYALDSEGKATVVTSESISVDGSFDSVDVAVVDSYATNFKITPTGTDPKTYVIEVTTNLEDSVLKTGTEIILTLEATVPDQADKGYASVVLSLPQIPKISESYYLAVYTVKDPDTDEVTITNGPIAYSSDSLAPVTATLTGDLADEYFTFTDVGDGTCTLQLTKDFDPTILSQGEDVIVTVVTSLPWGSNSIAPVIIKLPTVSTAPEFSSPVYTADYTIVADGPDTVTLSGSSITIVGDDSGAIPVVIADDSPYKENFGITFEAGIWQLSVTSDLSSDVLNENAEIMLILDAGEGAKKGHAPLLVKLPEKTSDIVPEFSALYFTASYLVDESSADTVTINEPITITSDQADLTAVRVTGTYASNFEANFDATSWQLVVTADFEADFITHNPEIYVTLEATLDGAKKPGGATVVMKLPSATLLPAPRFVKAHYTADYQVDGGGAATVVMTSDPIAVVSDNSDSVTLTGTNSANFKLDHADGSWNLGIETPLDAAVVAAGGEIILELQAKLDGAIDDGFATLLIKLPAVVPVAFDQTYYEATYTPNDGTNDDEITSNAITLTESGTVEVTGDYSTNFGVTCDAAYKCLLSVTTDLSDDVLNSQTEVLIALQASKAGDEANKATATVLVNLPRKEEINTPHFSQTVYTVTYARNEGVDVITLDNGPISIPGEDFEKLTVTVTGTHEESFTVTPVDDHWEISLAADLPDDVLNDETLLALELKATLEGSSSPGSAALVVKLPKKQTPTAFYFSAPVYIGEYADETTPEIVMEEEIVIQGDFLDNIDVVLEGEHSEFFTPNYDAAGKVTVAVDELPDEILDNNLIITLDVLASLRGSDSAPVTAGLVVKLAQQSPGSLISFSDVVYEAQYSDDDGPKLDVDGDITIDGPGGLEIDVTVTGEYAKYFTSTYADGKVTLQVSEIPSSVTDEKAVITINLEATVAATTTKTLAGLVVKLPLASGDSSGSDDPDVTAYIVVICLLSVLMVGFILASAYVYYRKRRGRKHADVEEYMNTENKFTRNPKVSEVNKFDHPTRRATGMIRYSISLPDDGSPPDSTTDMEEAPPERRKSVQFDDNVEERPIDSREHDDSDNESSDGSDRGEDSVSNRSDEGSHHEDRTQM